MSNMLRSGALRRALAAIALSASLLTGLPDAALSFTLSQGLASTMLVAGDAQYNSGTLVMLSGTQPASPGTALSGNTTLCTWTFSATAFAAPTFSTPYEQALASLVSTACSPVATGTATFVRAYKSDGTTALADYTVAATGTPDITVGSTSVVIGTSVTLTTFYARIPAL